ncbi:hypothetical protein FH972_026512 [Carpinus fangiana]|uniref:Uncharacterized protein n=1 Tax=Carpinus fangiana TaxID=176857 RepID=A0A5N6L4P0_9ROSI|nr:hypothetical protein FH972_026512 [Carpinus fangiana]
MPVCWVMEASLEHRNEPFPCCSASPYAYINHPILPSCFRFLFPSHPRYCILTDSSYAPQTKPTNRKSTSQWLLADSIVSIATAPPAARAAPAPAADAPAAVYVEPRPSTAPRLVIQMKQS